MFGGVGSSRVPGMVLGSLLKLSDYPVYFAKSHTRQYLVSRQVWHRGLQYTRYLVGNIYPLVSSVLPRSTPVEPRVSPCRDPGRQGIAPGRCLALS